MNKWIGIALALTALIGGGLLYGWQGLVLGVTIVSFWLLLQFSRFIRVMRIAAEGPMGQIDNAVMLSTKMRQGMKLVELLPLRWRQIPEDAQAHRKAGTGGRHPHEILVVGGANLQ